MDNRKNEQIMELMYKEAKIMLTEICPENVDLNKYFNLEKTFKSKNDIMHTLLIALQDKQRSDNVIGITKKEKKETFRKLFFDYDCDMILNNYDENTLLEMFRRNFKINNIESSRNLWRLYARSVISGAKFLNNFNNAIEFDEFVLSYKNNKIELIELLQSKIFGMGFAVACNFLKDLGYEDYAKPDVHIKDIFLAFNLCDDSDYSVFNAVLDMSKVVSDSAYNIDRLFWLICSGKFFLDDVSIGKNKENYINRVKSLTQKFKLLNTNDINEVKSNNIKLSFNSQEDKQKDILKLAVTKCSKFKNNYKYDYARIVLNDRVVEKFFNGEDKDKKVLDIMIKYDSKKDSLIIEKI